MYYYGNNYGSCCSGYQNCCQQNNSGKGYAYALILVLFILLVIIGAAKAS